MISKGTIKAIETIKAMQLKIAVPPRLSGQSGYVSDKCATTTTVDTEYIYVPDVIVALETEIKEAYRQVDDIKRATRLLFGIAGAR